MATNFVAIKRPFLGAQASVESRDREGAVPAHGRNIIWKEA
jgi:hypothetical protein